MNFPSENRWFRLIIGVALLASFFALLTTEPRPPGLAGEIIERNLKQDVQATALFYADLECMSELEERLARPVGSLSDWCSMIGL